MQTNTLNVLLPAFAIGAIIGVVLWLAGLSPYQAFMVGSWFGLGGMYFQSIRREKKRKRLTIFSWIFLLVINLLALVIQAFGYGTDYRLIFLMFITFNVILGVEYFIKQVRLKMLLYAVAAIAMLVYGVPRLSRCSFVPCQPARWTEQVTLMQQAMGTYDSEWNIESIRAEPSFRNIFWFTEQPNFEIRVFATRAVSDTSNAELAYDITSFSYNDIDPQRTLELEGSAEKISTFPQARQTELLAAVQISPREAFDRTHGQGQRFLGRMPASYQLDIELQHNEDVAVEFGTQAVWEVTYWDLDRGKQVRFWVSASTGDILKQEEKTW